MSKMRIIRVSQLNCVKWCSLGLLGDNPERPFLGDAKIQLFIEKLLFLRHFYGVGNFSILLFVISHIYSYFLFKRIVESMAKHFRKYIRKKMLYLQLLMKRMYRRKTDTDNTIGISSNVIHCAILFNEFFDVVKPFRSIKGIAFKSQDVNMVGSIKHSVSVCIVSFL